jgi:hypothetical protein
VTHPANFVCHSHHVFPSATPLHKLLHFPRFKVVL